jgi:hypothetical protein
MVEPGTYIVEDPAADAARLLHRLGIAVLMIALPVLMVVSRREIFIAMPVGAALLLISAVVMPTGGGARYFAGVHRVLGSNLGIAALVLGLWAGVSLLWTPLADESAGRYFKCLMTAVLVVLVTAFLPARTRPSNLHLLPIGVAGTALVVLLIGLFGHGYGKNPDVEQSELDRAVLTIDLLLWPALGALSIRGRWPFAYGLPVLVALATLVAGSPVALFAIAAGAVSFALTMPKPQRGAQTIAVIFAGIMLVAPVVPLAIAPLLPASALQSWAAPLGTWADIVSAEGARLITGHGLDMAARATVYGLLPENRPTSLLFEIWYELGVVGACSGAALTFFVFAGAGLLPATLAPFFVAGLVSGVTLAFVGQVSTQLWWVTLIGDVAIAYALLAHSQFRVTRPAVPVGQAEARMATVKPAPAA